MYQHDLIKLDSTVLDEAYIGKTPILLEIEQKFHQLRNRKDFTINTASSTFKEVIEINRLIEKQFGFEAAAIYIDPSQYFDAYNIPIGIRFDFENIDLKQKIEGDQSRGYRFKRGSGIALQVTFTYGALANKKISDASIVACLLHEIGHVFGDVIYDKIRFDNNDFIDTYRRLLMMDIFTNAIAMVCTLGIFGTKDVIEDIKILKNYNNKNMLKKNKKYNSRRPNSGRVAAWFKGMKAKRNDKKSDRTAAPEVVSQDYIDAIRDFKSSEDFEKKKEYFRNDDLQRRSEVLADKFPTIYGYGVEFAELLTVFDTTSGDRAYRMGRRGLKTEEQRRIFDEIQKEFFDFNDIDCHPQNIQRMTTLLRTLKAEYKKTDIDPKLKKEILYQIEEIEKCMEDLADASTKVYRIDKARALYNNYLLQNVPDAVALDIEEEMDAMLDKALEKEEKRHNK